MGVTSGVFHAAGMFLSRQIPTVYWWA